MATTEEKMLEEAYSVTPNFSVDPNDKRFADVKDARQDALDENSELYAGMIDKTDAFYDKQIQLSQDWADKQTELQNQRTDFAIEQIEQQKDQAHKDYLKEQSASYVDWQKQSNQYGTEAERMASAGLTGTGFAESSQVSMYNTYQNRVATAREVHNRAVLNFANAIKDAQLQNNAVLAEIAYEAYKEQEKLALEGFQYKNQLVLDQANKKLEIENMYWNRYLDVYDQINAENSIKADIWKYQDNQKWQTEQNEIQRAFEAEENQKDRDFEAEEARIEREFKAKEAELERKHDKEMLEAETKAEKEMLEQKYKNDLAILAQELENEKAMLAYEKSLSSSRITGGSIKEVTSNASKIVSGVSKAISSNTKKPNNIPTNKASIMALGYGAISPEKLEALVNNGTVTTYTKNGQMYFKKNTTPINYKYRLTI